LDKETLLINVGELKLFNKSDFIDNYIYVVFEEKLVAMVRQKSIVQATKNLFGVELN
jgi:hypothetical protein